MATARPPFDQHVPGIFNFHGPWQALKVEPYSDGDAKHWPGKPTYTLSDERGYKIKLARTWAQHLGISVLGINYYLEDLPDGYGLYEARQPGGPAIYKRLFGHPTGRYYDSVLKFETHFLWLMSGMEGDCGCVLCGKSKFMIARPRQPREILPAEPRRRRNLIVDDPGAESARSSSAGGLATGRERRARGIGQTYPMDEEGTRDVYKECVQSLFKNKESRKGIKDDIIEEDSLDHEAEHEALTQYFTRVEQQHSFIPRIGELVLWCNYFPDDHYILKDSEANEFKFYTFNDKTFIGFPDWRAGLVTAVPDSSAVDGPIDFPDILDLPTKKTDLNSSGFRVETVPDSNKADKSASKQYRYLALRSIRPLAHWQYLLHGFPHKSIHPSIYHALTLMTSVSLVDKYEITGAWPNGSIHCKGIFMGAELITTGDVVRISSVDPSEDEPFQDILVISSIRMNLVDILDDHAHVKSPLLCSETNITLIGSAYTNSPFRDYRWPRIDGKPDRAFKGNLDPVDLETAKHLFRPVGTNECGPWYPMHSMRHRYEVSHEQVLGRLHETYAVQLWTGHQQFRHDPNQVSDPPDYNFDLAGIIAGRRYATQTDQRIPSPPSEADSPIMWHLADYRAQGLAIASSNGLDVGLYDQIRTRKTLTRWRNVLKVRRGDIRAAKELVISYQRGRPAGTRVVDGKLVDAFVDVADTADVVFTDDQNAGYAGKRRGRPPGSKIVDGKLVYPPASQSQGMKSAAREETESETSVDEDVDMMEIENSRTRAMGGLDGNRSFEHLDSPPRFGDDDDQDDVDGVLLREFQRASSTDDNEEEADNPPPRASSSKANAPVRPTSSKGKAPVRLAPLTKQEIMGSIEVGEMADDEEEDEDWLHGPLPPARGGTEESDGGDYDPSKESQEERAARKSKERKEQPKAKFIPRSGDRAWVDNW